MTGSQMRQLGFQLLVFRSQLCFPSKGIGLVLLFNNAPFSWLNAIPCFPCCAALLLSRLLSRTRTWIVDCASECVASRGAGCLQTPVGFLIKTCLAFQKRTLCRPRPSTPPGAAARRFLHGDPRMPATSKHGWSKHGSSRIHSIQTWII